MNNKKLSVELDDYFLFFIFIIVQRLKNETYEESIKMFFFNNREKNEIFYFWYGINVTSWEKKSLIISISGDALYSSCIFPNSFDILNSNLNFF